MKNLTINDYQTAENAAIEYRTKKYEKTNVSNAGTNPITVSFSEGKTVVIPDWKPDEFAEPCICFQVKYSRAFGPNLTPYPPVVVVSHYKMYPKNEGVTV